MIVLKLSIILFVACHVTGQFVIGVPGGPPKISIYDGVWDKTAIKVELTALRMTVEDKRATLRHLDFPVGATINVNEFNIMLKKFGIRLADVIIDYLEALENIVATGNIPADEVFEQFERPSRRFRKFLASEGGKFVHETRELIGCGVAREFNAVFESIDHQVEFIAPALHRIREAVRDKENKLEFVLRQATIVFNRVVKIKAIIEKQIFISLIATVERILYANQVQGLIIYLEGYANESVHELINSAGKFLVNSNDTTHEIYNTGQLAITASLSKAIKQLSVFENNLRLSRLSHQIEENYSELYIYLSKQKLIDLVNIDRYYKVIFENTADLTQNMANIILDATNRTFSQYFDLYMNGYYNGVQDCSGSGYALQSYFDMFGQFGKCFESEQMAWNTTIDTFEASVNLLATASNAVSESITRCRNIEFATNPIIFAQSRACLKTNIRDTARLAKLLEPQFEQVDRLIKQNVAVSKFRLENCLATATHEITSMMRTSRSLLRSCARRIVECPIEEKYEDDEGDWYGRYYEALEHKKDDPKKSFLKTGFEISEEYHVELVQNKKGIDSEETTN